MVLGLTLGENFVRVGERYDFGGILRSSSTIIGSLFLPLSRLRNQENVSLEIRRLKKIHKSLLSSEFVGRRLTDHGLGRVGCRKIVGVASQTTLGYGR